MSLHLRPKHSDGELYHPGRDLAYVFRDMMENVAEKFNNQRWKELTLLMQREGVDFPELAEGMDVLCLFLVQARNRPDMKIMDAMKEVGWLDLKPQVQIGICAMLGSVVIGQLFAAIRDLSEMEAPGQPDWQPLIRYGRITKRIMYLPRWRQRLYFATRGLMRTLRRLIPKGSQE